MESTASVQEARQSIREEVRKLCQDFQTGIGKTLTSTRSIRRNLWMRSPKAGISLL